MHKRSNRLETRLPQSGLVDILMEPVVYCTNRLVAGEVP